MAPTTSIIASSTLRRKLMRDRELNSAAASAPTIMSERGLQNQIVALFGVKTKPCRNDSLDLAGVGLRLRWRARPISGKQIGGVSRRTGCLPRGIWRGA